tara:strand:- start:2928 stop:4760 length:1833 start_codon:yes stop_codon:yes gene_type:complete
MRHNKRKVTMFLVDKIVLYLGIFLSVLTAQDYKVITQQVSLSQSPMTSDSLVLQGSLGKNFHQTGSGDTLSLSGGLWNIASGIYSLPPTMKITFPDTINRFDKQIMVEAVVNDINGVESVELHAQIGGHQQKMIIPMVSVNDSTFEIRIDDSLKSIYNLRGQIYTLDGMANLGTSSFQTPTMQFAEEELSMADSTMSFYPGGLPANRWRLFSFPGKIDSNKVKPNNLEDGHVFYDWDPVAESWFKPDSIVIGRAYWFKHKYDEPVIFSNKDTKGYSVPLEPYEIKLHQGANMVGSPFPFPVRAELSEGVKGPYKYGSDLKEGWADTNVFEPWAGYAVDSPSDSGKITFYPIQDTTIAARTTNSGWRLNLDLSSNSSFDRTSAIGRCDACEEDVDMNDMRLLPSLTQRVYISLDIKNDGQFDHSKDLRSTSEFNGVWNMRVNRPNAEGSLTLKGAYENDRPNDLVLMIVNVSTREVLKNFPVESFELSNMNSEFNDFKVVAGEEAYVLSMVDEILNSIPTEFSLGQNYPNPFNPVTKMDISLPLTGDVTLVIYNILGQKVRTIFSGELNYGYHTMQWNGLDDQGLRVSSGVYFSEFRTRDHRKTKKMLLLK